MLYEKLNSLRTFYGNIVVVVTSLLSSFFMFIFFSRFLRFEATLRDVSSLLESWDRSTGNIGRVDTPKSETEPEVTQTGSNKKMRDKKGDREKERDKSLKEVNDRLGAKRE